MSATKQQIAELRHATHLLFDALDARSVYCERDTGVVDATAAEIAAALLAAGWTPPASQEEK